MRDALGVVRLLYAARKSAGRLVPPPEVDPLVGIGGELRAALVLGRQEPGSLGYRAGVARANDALTRLADAVTLVDHLPDLVRVARDRVAGRPVVSRAKVARSGG